MKGIEGLALQYIVLIVVAAIIIGAVFAIVTTFTSTAGSQATSLNKTVSSGFNSSSVRACESISGCKWNATIGECKCT